VPLTEIQKSIGTRRLIRGTIQPARLMPHIPSFKVGKGTPQGRDGHDRLLRGRFHRLLGIEGPRTVPAAGFIPGADRQSGSDQFVA
jgi:hypothetical protein